MFWVFLNVFFCFVAIGGDGASDPGLTRCSSFAWAGWPAWGSLCMEQLKPFSCIPSLWVLHSSLCVLDLMYVAVPCKQNKPESIHPHRVFRQLKFHSFLLSLSHSGIVFVVVVVVLFWGKIQFTFFWISFYLFGFSSASQPVQTHWNLNGSPILKLLLSAADLLEILQIRLRCFPWEKCWTFKPCWSG